MKQIKQRYQAGGATEHSYRGDLQTLLNELVKGIKVTNEPKREEFGAPDYVIKNQDIPIGYIEAKDIGVDLNKVEKSEQMKRYLKSLDNLVLTDYLEFRFYRYGEKTKEIKIGSADGKFISYTETYPLFIDYIRNFCDFEGQVIKSAEKLSKLMAQKARIMEEVIQKAIKTNHEDNTLRDQYKAFKEILIHDLDEDTFADIYAQTITYGMFAARLHDPNLQTFSRFEAAQLIPKSNPFLRKLFQYIAGYDLDNRIKWIVEALSDVFRLTDISALIKNMGDVTKQNDPIIHFYETFLSEYDPKLRKKRGVWYTPEPVVNFIVRAVDDILKTEFNLPEGLADNSKTEIKVDVQGKKEKLDVHKVQILDPAVGTGTFLAEIVKLIYDKFKGQQGVWNDYVENHLIPRLNGFELLMAPYAMAHLKLDLLLSETGFRPTKDQRFRIFLTNALEEHHPDTGTIFASWLSQEANEANFIKRDTPIMVVLGNPPYSGKSANKGKWIENLIDDYKQEPGGGKLKERNPKGINDDYVKFMRYGQYNIEKNEEGILAFISNHSFLFNPTFRGMRWHLLNTFDQIFIIDLHGNVKKREISPDGTIDENVFDIQQGVSINIFVKNKKKKKDSLAKVYICDLYGEREYKNKYLSKETLANINFESVEQEDPFYFFTRRSLEAKKEYELGFSIKKLYPINSGGLYTSRDNLTIHFSKESLVNTINKFMELDVEEARKEFGLGKDADDWQISSAKSDLEKTELNQDNTVKISYRPFDNRYTYYTGRSKGFHCRPRRNIMQHFVKRDNIGIIIGRQGQAVGSMTWNLCYITRNISDYNIYYRGGGTVFPLYLFTEEQNILEEDLVRKPNLNMEIVNKIAYCIGLKYTLEKDEGENKFDPLDILDYIYAVLHSPTYREKYKDFLEVDFPKIPYPSDQEYFWKLVKLGGKLRQIHLLESPEVEEFITSYPEDGSNEIERVIYENGKVWINEKQYFDNVPQEAWEFYIGGYQPAQKWLKDRKGRVLGYDDVRHYHKIIKALVETNRIMDKIKDITI